VNDGKQSVNQVDRKTLQTRKSRTASAARMVSIFFA
jgi:hypothetical protein